jgi:hypothetical protein
MDSVDSGTVWTVWILLWNSMNSVDFGTVWTVRILELYEQCGFCFRTV